MPNSDKESERPSGAGLFFPSVASTAFLRTALLDTFKPSPPVYDRTQVLNIRDSCFRPCHERELSLYTRKRPSAT